MLQRLITSFQKLNWSIRYKIGLAFALLLTCFIVNGVISNLLLFSIKANEENQRSISILSEQVQRYQITFRSEVQDFSDAIFITKKSFIRDNFRDLIVKEFQPDQIQNLSPASKQFTTRFAELYYPALNHFIELEKLINSFQLDQAVTKWHEYDTDFNRLTDFLGEQAVLVEKQRSTGENNLNGNIFLSSGLLVFLTIFSIGLALFLLYLIQRGLVQPINRLKQSLKRIAEGDLNQDIEIANRDEVGALAESYHQALLSLQQVLRGVQISENLRQVTLQLSEVSQEQSEGSTGQANALTEVISAMQEQSHMAGQIAEGAIQVANLTMETLAQIEQVAEAGNTGQKRARLMVEVVENTIHGVEEVGREVAEINLAMSELNKQSWVINKVVDLIGSIAEEVHMLALNAAIEAASAGGYGERFKVVAREIKQLAHRAGQATVEVRTILEEVQSRNGSILNRVEESQHKVGGVVEANNTMRQSLNDLERSAKQVIHAVTNLLAYAGEVSTRAEEIKRATQQQRISSEQVIASAHAVGEVARQTASASQEIAVSSLQLEHLADQLAGVLNGVKLAA